MGVYIKGMEMPTACRHGECNFACSAAYQTGLICVVRKQYVVPGDVPRDCPCSLDVQPVKHGRWVQDAVYVDETTGEPCLAWFCNQCGEPQMVGTNYCPHCGAKMDGAE